MLTHTPPPSCLGVGGFPWPAATCADPGLYLASSSIFYSLSSTFYGIPSTPYILSSTFHCLRLSRSYLLATTLCALSYIPYLLSPIFDLLSRAFHRPFSTISPQSSSIPHRRSRTSYLLSPHCRFPTLHLQSSTTYILPSFYYRRPCVFYSSCYGFCVCRVVSSTFYVLCSIRRLLPSISHLLPLMPHPLS